MPIKLYRVKDWNTRFENNRTRDLKRLDWVPIPNDPNDDAYCHIMTLDDGPAIFGAWVALVMVASRCGFAVQPSGSGARSTGRGILVQDTGKPHDAATLSRKSRIDVRLMERALEVLASPDVNWLEVSTLGDDEASCFENVALACDNPAPSCSEGKGMEENGMEWKGSAGRPALLPDADWLAALKSDATYRGIDVDREYGKMVNWCKLNHKQPSRRRFLNWLNRVEAPMTAAVQQQVPVGRRGQPI